MIYSFWLEGIYYLLNFIQKTTKNLSFSFDLDMH